MAGTGLPLLQSKPVLAEAPKLVDGDQFSSAGAWGKMAAAAESVANTFADIYAKDIMRQEAGHLAGDENEIQGKRIELRDQYANDPEGFKTVWNAYTDGKIEQAPPWAVNHIKKYAGSQGNSAYSEILGERRTRDRHNAATALESRETTAQNEIFGLAAAGKIGDAVPEWQEAHQRYSGIVNTVVATGVKPQEWADQRIAETNSRVGAISGIRAVSGVYDDALARGDDPMQAATGAADRIIRQNTSLNLTEAQRTHYYHAAISEARARDAVRKGDLADARAAANELNLASATGITVRPDDVDRVAGAFRAAGAPGEAAKLYAAYARKPLNDEFGRQPIPEQTKQLRELRGIKDTSEFLHERRGNPNVRVEGLNPAFATPLQLAIADAEQATGSKAQINSLHRTHEEQSRAYARYLRGENALAAKPGSSRHEIGDAADIQPGPVLDWLHKNAGNYGLEFLQGDAFRRDPVHIQLARNGAARAPVTTAQGVTGEAPGAGQSAWLAANRQRTLDTQAREAWTAVLNDYNSKGIRPNSDVVNSLVDAARATGARRRALRSLQRVSGIAGSQLGDSWGARNQRCENDAARCCHFPYGNPRKREADRGAKGCVRLHQVDHSLLRAGRSASTWIA